MTSSSSVDQFFAPGRLLTLSLTVDQTVFLCKASILKSFLPFTKSQVLLVDLQPLLNGLATPVILKVYDPRFINDREQPSLPSSIPDRPWSLSLEVAAAERRKAIARNERPDDYNEENFVDFDELLWEEFFYRTTEDAFNSELGAYSCLRDFQGEGIPRCYASGNLAVDPHRPISPHVLVLEYIPGETLTAINPSSVPRPLARSLITTVCSFASHGVIHCDLRADNIIFSSQQPSRVVVIDFGQSISREHASDSEWESIVESEGNENMVKHLLHKSRIRDLDPRLPQIYPNPHGAKNWNWWAETQGQRWCVPTEDWTGPGSVRLDEPIRWKLKDEVTAWLAAKHAGLLTGVDPPRPGSPGYVPLSP
jgi:serine/threonine protein kinase